MEKITDLQELLKHELKDLYSAEVQLIEAIPAMAEKATNPELKKAFTDHLKITREHRDRLEKIQSFFNMEKVEETKGFFANLFKSKEGEEHCKAMEGLVKEVEYLMDEDMSPEVMDAALIAAAQKVEHYEISSYGTARAYATQLGFSKVVDLLSSTLKEEYAADDLLTTIAVGKVNLKAEEGADAAPGNNKTGSKKTSDASQDKKIKEVNAKPAAKNNSKTASSTVKQPAKKTAKPAPKKLLVKKAGKPVSKKSAVKRRKTTA